jgi:hypothetical protein
MPTLMPTRATPDGTRRTYGLSGDEVMGLSTGLFGLHGTPRTL